MCWYIVPLEAGHVLSAWLVYARGFSIEEALSAVKKIDRDPYEAVKCGNATIEELYALLRTCQECNAAK